MSTPLASVVIPAHNEAGVIARCLQALLAGFAPGELAVLVVCNGCTDETAAIAREFGGVAVLELETASKPAALRAGDATADAFPRLYLDADVVLSSEAARAVIACLADGAPAARPPVAYDFADSSRLVQSYYRARVRVPAVMGSLWGAGVCGLSDAGRARFERFPDAVADDLWLDRQFLPDEVQIVDCAPVVVRVPRRTRDLVHVLRRVYRGNAENRAAFTGDRPAESARATIKDLGRLMLAGPRSARDATTYAVLAGGVRIAVRYGPSSIPRWERDESSRAEPA